MTKFERDGFKMLVDYMIDDIVEVHENCCHFCPLFDIEHNRCSDLELEEKLYRCEASLGGDECRRNIENYLRKEVDENDKI